MMTYYDWLLIAIQGPFCAIAYYKLTEFIIRRIREKYPVKRIIHRFEINNTKVLLMYDLPRELTDKYWQSDFSIGYCGSRGPKEDIVASIRSEDIGVKNEFEFQLQYRRGICIRQSEWNEFLKSIGEPELK